MLRKVIVPFLFSICLSSFVLAAPFLYMGETNDDGVVSEVWMDEDIQPVGRLTFRNRVEVVPGIYTSKYKINLDRKAEMSTSMGMLVDVKAVKSLNFFTWSRKWEADKQGLDGLLFNAYLIKNYKRINSKEPFVVKDEDLLKNREPDWGIDRLGWLKVYEQKEGSEAWVQTQSAMLSTNYDSDYPSVRVLVRRSELVDGKKVVGFSYDEFDPIRRMRAPLKTWDSNGKIISDEALEPVAAPILSKEAAIGTQGYYVFLVNRSEIEKRGLFSATDGGPDLPLSWFDFQ